MTIHEELARQGRATASINSLIYRSNHHDSRLDTISWKNSDWVEVIQGGTGKSLKYRIGTKYSDPYGQKWEILGDASILGIHLKKNNEQTIEMNQLYSARVNINKISREFENEG